MNRDEALKQSDEALKELSQSLSQGMSDKLLNYLAAMARFHQYSFGNCIMIYMQKPDATQVAGFGKWKEMNRFVKKGEKGIAIFAPMVGKKKSDKDSKDASSSNANQSNSESSDATCKNKVLYGFRVVHVFDVSQTEGQDLPEFASLDGDPGDKIDRLIEIYRNEGVALEFVPSLPRSANGMSAGGTVSIVESLPKPQMFSTMVHELAHEMLHWGDRRETTTKVVRETEAEAVAFAVCRSIGLECSTRASDYIQLWTGDEKVLMQSLEQIRSVASKILTQLQDVPSEQATSEQVKEVAHVA
jgi:hypothetical protein